MIRRNIIQIQSDISTKRTVILVRFAWDEIVVGRSRGRRSLNDVIYKKAPGVDETTPGALQAINARIYSYAFLLRML